jgi:hypothetical protein
MVLLQERKEITLQINDLVKEAAKIGNKKKSNAKKTFDFLRILHESGEDDLEEISTFFIEIKDTKGI